MAVDLNDTDRAILDVLSEGRGTPAYLADETGFTRQAIQGRLTVLRAGEYVEKVHTGLYGITEKGQEEIDN